MSVSLNPSSAYTSTQTVYPCPKSTFEKNSDAYGPVVASAIGIAQSVADGASTTVSLSEKALGKVVDSVEDAGTTMAHGIESAESGLQSAAHAIRNGLNEAENAVEQTYDSVKDTATSVYDEVANAASNVSDAISSVGSKLASYAAIGAQAVKDVI